MDYIVLGIVAVWIGHLVGQQTHWATWHGPTGSVLVVPIALALGLDPALSVVGSLCLGAGFLVARFAA